MRLLALVFLLIQEPSKPEFAPPRPVPPAVEETRNVLRGLRLYKPTKDGMQFVGSACPVDPAMAYTAAHVVKAAGMDLYAHPDYGFRFDASLLMRVTVGKVDDENDTAQLIAPEFLLFWFKRGGPPLPGGTVIGSMPLYDNQMAPTFGHYLGYIEGMEPTRKYHLSTIMSAPGASGSCALNDKGEAWGITLGTHLWGTDVSDPSSAKATRHAAIPKKN